MGEVVMVMLRSSPEFNAFSRPVPLTRVWCIFEAWASEATNSKFSIAMTQAEAHELVETVCKDPLKLLATLRRICCEASTATKTEDRDRIFDTIRQSVGFAQLDSTVASRMLDAVCAELHRQAVSNTASRPQALRALALFRVVQGKHDEGEKLHRDCLALANAAGLTTQSLAARISIATACSRQGKRKEAREYYQSVHDELEAKISAHDFMGLEAASGLALELHAVKAGRHKADILANQWVPACVKARCGPALYRFGLLRLAQGRFAHAEELLKAAVDALREHAGGAFAAAGVEPRHA
jgi:hypothetical protein